MRVDDVSYNINAAFFAAMSMLDKKVEYRVLPHVYMNIDGKPIHFVGERNHAITEVIVEGDQQKGKYIVWYVYGEEVIGFMTVGYQNLHLYLQEAMKLLIMPPAKYLRSRMIDHKNIVASVFKCRPEIKANRNGILRTASVIRAEFTREREELEGFRTKIRKNVSDEKENQRMKFNKIKAKYDREGVDVVEDEQQIGQDMDKTKQKLIHQKNIQIDNEEREKAVRDGTNLVRTRSGKGYKPGGSAAYLQDDLDIGNYDRKNLNMGSGANPKFDSTNPFN